MFIFFVYGFVKLMKAFDTHGILSTRAARSEQLPT